LDITIHKGHAGKPVVIFIHGLAVNREIWIRPLETKVFAENIPLKYIAAAPPEPGVTSRKRIITAGIVPEKIDNLWTILKDEGYNLACWTQRRPVGPIAAAVEDLEDLWEEVKRVFPGRPVALIGHSRGGLIARKFMESKRPEIKTLVTIASPHQGSSLSNIAKYLEPLKGVLRKILPRDTHGTAAKILKRISDLVEGNVLKELMPGSEFFRKLCDSPSNEIHYLSFGGYKTELVTLYKWEKDERENRPSKLITIPDSLLKFIPAVAVPDEMTPGKGDIMVSAKSSVLPWASDHYDLKANHFTILWDPVVISKTLEVLEGIS
jgi:pimeloyl-ACP methyl ester carboxylesterase